MLSRSCPCWKAENIASKIWKSIRRSYLSQTKSWQTKLTRSQTSPYNKDACFFCHEVAGYRETLHSVSTTSAGQSIRDAVEISGNELLRIKLSTAIDANDTHAKDIKYYSKCYVNNVTSVLRRSRSPPDRDNSNMTAKVEFIDITESALREGKPLNMAELEETYTPMLERQPTYLLSPVKS